MINQGPSAKRQRSGMWYESSSFNYFDYLLTQLSGLPTHAHLETLFHASILHATVEDIQQLFFAVHPIDNLRAFLTGVTPEASRSSRIAYFLNTPDIAGRTALHLAARNGLLNKVQLLLEHGANKDRLDSLGQTPGDLAFQNRHLRCAARLGHLGALETLRTKVSASSESLSPNFQPAHSGSTLLFPMPAQSSSSHESKSKSHSSKRPRLG